MRPSTFLRILLPVIALSFGHFYILSARADAHVQLRLWPKANMGLGHVGLLVTPDDGSRAINLGYSQYTPGFWEIDLKTVSNDQLAKFVEWYKGPALDERYSFILNNCAHDTLRALKVLGYPVRHWTKQWALTPGSVYREAKRIMWLKTLHFFN